MAAARGVIEERRSDAVGGVQSPSGGEGDFGGIAARGGGAGVGAGDATESGSGGFAAAV